MTYSILNMFLLVSFSRKNINKDEKESVVSEVLSIVKGKESDVSIVCIYKLQWLLKVLGHFALFILHLTVSPLLSSP